MITPTLKALEFKEKNNYRECTDRSCDYCAKAIWLYGKLQCTGAGSNLDCFPVHQDSVCNAWERNKNRP